MKRRFSQREESAKKMITKIKKTKCKKCLWYQIENVNFSSSNGQLVIFLFSCYRCNSIGIMHCHCILEIEYALTFSRKIFYQKPFLFSNFPNILKEPFDKFFGNHKCLELFYCSSDLPTEIIEIITNHICNVLIFESCSIYFENKKN